MEQFGISKLDLKRRNRMQILKRLQHRGSASRIDLSSSLELTRAAVTIITNEMIAEHVLYEKGELSTIGQKASRGRKKVLIDINENYKFTFGVAVEHKRVYIGLSNLGGQLLEKRILELHPNDTWEFALHQIFLNMRELLANNCLTEEQVLGAGICMNARAMRLLQIQVVDHVPDYSALTAAFKREFLFPVVCDSLINGIACAERDFSHRHPADENFVTIHFSDRIEAALVVGGELYRGFSNNAMNLERVAMRSAACGGGQKGYAEEAFSDEDAYVKILNLFSEQETPKLYQKMDGNPNQLRVADIHEYLCLGDAGVEQILEERLQSYVTLINNLVCVLDPQRIVFYGRQFETEAFMRRIKDRICDTLGQEVGELISASCLRQNQICLSGCALSVRRFFIERGGFSQTKE